LLHGATRILLARVVFRRVHHSVNNFTLQLVDREILNRGRGGGVGNCVRYCRNCHISHVLYTRITDARGIPFGCRILLSAEWRYFVVPRIHSGSIPLFAPLVEIMEFVNKTSNRDPDYYYHNARTAVSFEVGERLGIVGDRCVEIKGLRIAEIGVRDGDGGAGPVGGEPTTVAAGVVAASEVVITVGVAGERASFWIALLAFELVVVLRASVRIGRYFPTVRIEVRVVADYSGVRGHNAR